MGAVFPTKNEKSVFRVEGAKASQKKGESSFKTQMRGNLSGLTRSCDVLRITRKSAGKERGGTRGSPSSNTRLDGIDIRYVNEGKKSRVGDRPMKVENRGERPGGRTRRLRLNSIIKKKQGNRRVRSELQVRTKERRSFHGT